MLQLNNSSIRVKCSNGHWVPVPIEEWDNPGYEINEKPDCAMGNEIGHHLDLFDYPCSECGAKISEKMTVWEYPVGNLSEIGASENVNHDDVKSAVTLVP